MFLDLEELCAHNTLHAINWYLIRVPAADILTGVNVVLQIIDELGYILSYVLPP